MHLACEFPFPSCFAFASPTCRFRTRRGVENYGGARAHSVHLEVTLPTRQPAFCWCACSPSPRRQPRLLLRLLRQYPQFELLERAAARFSVCVHFHTGDTGQEMCSSAVGLRSGWRGRCCVWTFCLPLSTQGSAESAVVRMDKITGGAGGVASPAVVA